jgi:hypothetical protein
MPAPPQNFGLAFAVHQDQLSACIAVAWRVDGVAHIGIIKHDDRTDWLYTKVLEISRKYKKAIYTDGKFGVNTDQVDKLRRARPTPQIELLSWPAVSTATVTFIREYQSGNLVHYAHEGLDLAVRTAVKRGYRDTPRWTFGRGPGEEDVTPLESASMALRAYDEQKPRVPITIITG